MISLHSTDRAPSATPAPQPLMRGETRLERPTPLWHIAYKGKSTHGGRSLRENLDTAGVEYFIPTQVTERLVDDRMVEHTEEVLTNLIFIRTDEDIRTLTSRIDGLRAPYTDRSTGNPATVSDPELQRFRRVLEARSLHAEFLPDAYRRFDSCPKVRVKAGDFEGLTGRVFRIRHDRKLIINLDNIAIAISGIHHTLLEVMEG